MTGSVRRSGRQPDSYNSSSFRSFERSRKGVALGTIDISPLTGCTLGTLSITLCDVESAKANSIFSLPKRTSAGTIIRNG